MSNLVSISEAKAVAFAVIGGAFREKVRPPNIHIAGPPGCAKSAMVPQIADSISKEINRPVSVIDVRLGSMESSEVNGIPHNQETGRILDIIKLDDGNKLILEKKMVFSTPEWFPVGSGDFDADEACILFLDELTNCDVSTQHAAYRLLQDYTIQNGAKLPECCAIISAGNRKEDKTGARKLLPAAANRIGVHMTIDVSTIKDDFVDYAVGEGFHRSIIGYLNWRPQNVYNNNGESDAFATLRTWDFVNRHLQNPLITANERLRDISVIGAIGQEVGLDFIGFLEYDGLLPDFKSIREGTSTYEVQDGNEGLKYAITTALAIELLTVLNLDDVGQIEKEANNLAPLAKSLPSELQVVMFRTMQANAKVARRLLSIPSLKEMFQQVAPKLKAF